MLDLILRCFTKEALRHPSILLVLLLATGAAGGALVYQPVSSDEFNAYVAQTESKISSVTKSIDCLNTEVKISNLEGQLRAAETELWNLQREEKSGEFTNTDYVRMDKIKSDINIMTRRVDQLRRCQ